MTENERNIKIKHYYFAGESASSMEEANKYLDSLIEYDKAGQNILNAGKHWKYFNSEKGFDALAKIDRAGNIIYTAGKTWKRPFDFEKALDFMIEKNKRHGTGEWIARAGADWGWKNFNFEKGMEALFNSNNNPEWIVFAGNNWGEFDYNKGLDALIRIDKSGESIYKAGLNWKQFDFQKGTEAIVKASPSTAVFRSSSSGLANDYLIHAGEEWDKFDFDFVYHYFEKTFATQKSQRRVYTAGNKWKNFPKDRFIKLAYKTNNLNALLLFGTGWKDFDKQKALDFFKKKESYVHIYNAGNHWTNIDYDELLKFLKDNNEGYYERALKNWPKRTAKLELEYIKHLDKKPRKKIPNKKLVLESREDEIFFNGEEAKNPKEAEFFLRRLLSLENVNGETIINAGITWNYFNYKKAQEFLTTMKRSDYLTYSAGCEWKKFDYEKGLNTLIEKDRDGLYISKAGERWKKFDFDKGFEALINRENVNESRLHIYTAGKYWKKFDYKRGLDALIKIDKGGEYILKAGLNWGRFDYKKALDALKEKEGGFLYNIAIREWPMTAKEALKYVDNELEKKNKKIPNKKMVLEGYMSIRERMKKIFERKDKEEQKRVDRFFENNWGSDNCRTLVKAVKELRKYDFKEAQNLLFELDEDGLDILNAGSSWKGFNQKKGLDALIKVDRRGDYIVNAGMYWFHERFDYRRAYNAVIKKDFAADCVVEIGKSWPRIAGLDYDKLLDDLIMLEKNAKFISARVPGQSEIEFIIRAAVHVRKENRGKLVFKAGREWPKFNIEKGLKALKDMNSEYYETAKEAWSKAIRIRPQFYNHRTNELEENTRNTIRSIIADVAARR